MESSLPLMITGTQRSARPQRGTGSTALTPTPQGHCPLPTTDSKTAQTERTQRKATWRQTSSIQTRSKAPSQTRRTRAWSATTRITTTRRKSRGSSVLTSTAGCPETPANRSVRCGATADQLLPPWLTRIHQPTLRRVS